MTDNTVRCLRRGVGWVALVALAVAVAPALGERAVEAQPVASNTQVDGTSPSVLLITIDTLRADILGSYGGRARTPALDGLAQSGARFDSALSHAVLTLPSHASLFTGVDPSRHGVHDNVGFRLGDQFDTWAERFSRAGYATGAFVAAFPLDSQFGIAQGFDLYDDQLDGDDGGGFQVVQRAADKVVAPARRWLRRQRGSWFLWVHVYDPHAPHVAPEPFASEYPGDPYAGEVAATDAALAPLIEDAINRGVLVIVTADHGEGLGDHGELSHGVFAYESTLRVPLIMAWPERIAAGTVVSDRVRLIDVMPTACELVDIECTGTDGESVAGVVRGGGSVGSRRVYFESLAPSLTRGWAPLRGIYDGEWKFIDLPIPELYHMPVDAGEARNLADVQVRRVNAMRELLQEHLEAVDPTSLQPQSESAETLERLRSLGYLGGTSSVDPEREWTPDDDPKRLIGLDTALQIAIGQAAAGDVDAAAARFRQILELRPDFLRVHMLLAQLEARRGNLDAAIDQLDSALRVDRGRVSLVRRHSTRSPYLLTDLGEFLRQAGRLDEAAEVLQDALVDEPENLMTLNLLASVEGLRGNFEVGMQLLDLGLELDPSYAPLHANRGTMLLTQGQVAEAKLAFERAIREDVRLAEAHNALGVIASREGNPEAAVDAWRTAVAIDEELYDALYNLGFTLVKLNRFAEAGSVLETFIATAPPRQYADDIAAFERLLAQIRGESGG